MISRKDHPTNQPYMGQLDAMVEQIKQQVTQEDFKGFLGIEVHGANGVIREVVFTQKRHGWMEKK